MDNIEIIIKAVKDYIRRCMEPLGERIKALEEIDARIKALEASTEWLKKRFDPNVRRIERQTSLTLPDGTTEWLTEKLEMTQPFQYMGVYAPGKLYTRGNFVTYQGSLWHCNNHETADGPGDGESWTLAVKHGRDGRDAQ